MPAVGDARTVNDYEEAREVALKYLEYAARTSVEVRRRLARSGYEEEVINAVVADMERAGLLDDARFSRDWVSDRAPRKGYGRERLAAELRQKGIGKELAREAVSGMDEDTEKAVALQLAHKRLGADDPGDPAFRRRLSAFLQRRGYNWQIIEQVLSELVSNSA